MNDYQVNVCNKNVITERIEEFILIENETSELLGPKKYGQSWSKKEFFYDLKNKWKYSFYCCRDSKVNGFLITSNYNNKIHAHRLATKTNLKTREKLKIIRLLYKNLEVEAKKNNIESMSAIIPIANKSIFKFYKQEGWIQLNQEEIEDFITERNMEAYSRHPNLLVDKYPTHDNPSVSFVLRYFYNY